MCKSIWAKVAYYGLCFLCFLCVWNLFVKKNKTALIPSFILLLPLLLINNKLESDFKIKANYFNNFFASKCTPLVNNSTIPSSLNYVSTARLSSLYVNEEVILEIINALNIDKAHGYDDISIWMIKLCCKSVVKHLYMIFNNCTDTSTFPDIWKRSNIMPVHKKGDKQTIDNYRPFPLLPRSGKFFEKLLFNSIMNFYLKIYLIPINQVSGQMALVRVNFFQ